MSNFFGFRHRPDCIYRLSCYGIDRQRRNNPPEPREHWFFQGSVYIGDEKQEESQEDDEAFPVAQRQEEETFAETCAPNTSTAFSSTDCETCVCCICLSLQRNILLYPCRHFVVCAECIQQIQTCPICRESIIVDILNVVILFF